MGREIMILIAILTSACNSLPDEARPTKESVADEAVSRLGLEGKCRDEAYSTATLVAGVDQFKDKCVWCHPDDPSECTEGYRPGKAPACFLPESRHGFLGAKWHPPLIVMASGYESDSHELHELGHHISLCLFGTLDRGHSNSAFWAKL